ncbi:MAG: flagellar hook-basal body complex protein [Clostridia bacterium]|nr:flagellar hook-basal body complex protein [Clostridia bacterium]
MFYQVSVDQTGAVVAQLRDAATAKDIGDALGIDASADSATLPKGTKVIVGYIALASFTNPSGLEKLGANNYSRSQNSGTPEIGHPGDAGYGKLIGGSKEMSNVDLSEEVVDMIVTQRGLQANSRIITVSDSILEELINLKR